MGDVIMTSPALHALKTSFGCTITLLTSSAGALIAPCLPVVDEVIVANLPWVKAEGCLDETGLNALVEKLKSYAFDAVIIFTVYSQSALPSAMLAFMAGIGIRIAYCRENPYGLLTHWVPDKEPYELIQHQVMRDIQLLKQLDITVTNPKLQLHIPEEAVAGITSLLAANGIDSRQPFIVLHPGVSEQKRMYPAPLWREAAVLLQQTFHYPIVLTGIAGEAPLCNYIQNNHPHIYNLAGKLSVAQLAAVVKAATLAVCVNTGTAHIAAAVDTPVIVLYANTNPQHTPWTQQCRVLNFTSPPGIESKNEVVAYVRNHHYKKNIAYPTASTILAAARQLLNTTTA